MNSRLSFLLFISSDDRSVHPPYGVVIYASEAN
jgi:hypothetical protein